MLDIERRADGSAVISGYVNAVGRDSKPVFIEKNKKKCRVIEQIQPGAFGEALRAAENVDMLLNHDSSRKLTDTASGGLTLTEDSIGLRAVAVVNDTEVIDKAEKGELRGWSFGFRCIEDEMETRSDKLPRRIVKHLILNEVSVIDSRFSPCYEGTSVECRAEGGADNGIEIRCFDSFASAADMEERVETGEAAPVDYSRYERAIAECSWKEYDGRIEERFNPYHDPVNGRFTSGAYGFSNKVTLYVGKGQKGNKQYIVKGDGGSFYKYDNYSDVSKDFNIETDMKYARKMAKKFGNIKYGGTLKSGDLFMQWNDEANKLSAELNNLRKGREGYISMFGVPVFAESRSFDPIESDEYG